MKPRKLLLQVALVPVLVACAGRSTSDGVFRVRGTHPDHPHLRYRDGQVSANDTCMIRVENSLNPAIPPTYVNGKPMGFC